MLISLLKYRKPSFIYLYTSFGVSLIILVVLSLISYRRLHLLVVSSNEADRAYNVILHFEKLENYVKDVETTGRGFMLTKDSSFLDQMNAFYEEVNQTIDSLRTLVKNDTVLSRHLIGINRIINKRINLQKLNIQKVALNDTSGLVESLNEGEYYMSQFRKQIQSVEEKK